MKVSFQNAFGVHEQALLGQARRAELLAANLANADTPNYRARDLDFKALLAQAGSPAPRWDLTTTHPAHFSDGARAIGGEPAYRVPQQPSVDGNTVDSQLEQAAYLQNALAYQASLTFLGQRIQGLRVALRGE